MKLSDYTLLLVEGNPADTQVIQEAIRKANITNPIQVVIDCDSAMAYLHGTKEYADREQYPLPKVILIDLALPRLEGYDVLRRSHLEPELRNLPVITLISDENPADRDSTYILGANSYLVKPLTPAEIWDVFESVSMYWPNIILVGKGQPE